MNQCQEIYEDIVFKALPNCEYSHKSREKHFVLISTINKKLIIDSKFIKAINEKYLKCVC